MNISLDSRTVGQIRLSTRTAIDEGDVEELREDILDAFTEDQTEALESVLEGGNLFDFISEILSEWDKESVDALLESLVSQFDSSGILLKLGSHVVNEDYNPDVDTEDIDEDGSDGEEEGIRNARER